MGHRPGGTRLPGRDLVSDKGADGLTAGPSIRTWLKLEEEATAPFTVLGDAVPAADSDLAALLHETVPPADGPKEPAPASDFAAKSHNLARAFAGQPALLLLNARLIALLRRRNPPAHIPGLFARLWAAHADDLADLHDARWLISSCRTLAEYGPTEVSRITGAELAMLADMMKLYESERLFSGTAPEDLFGGKRTPARLPLDLDAFAVGSGDLDRSVATRIWKRASGDRVAEALVSRLIPDILGDPRGVFLRLRRMRDRRRRRQAWCITPKEKPARGRDPGQVCFLKSLITADRRDLSDQCSPSGPYPAAMSHRARIGFAPGARSVRGQNQPKPEMRHSPPAGSGQLSWDQGWPNMWGSHQGCGGTRPAHKHAPQNHSNSVSLVTSFCS
ncbi:hypothetical protein [Gymnodinialimonas hymeniacidonis]|uniref:hypothetical protein n=1 Tax=Gymnodinialimonas hymeniacidonis TaxID=3126508 RepID=UPI0034C5FBE5